MPSKVIDYYQTLNVSRSATDEEIRSAYRRAAREHHPDLHAEKDKDLHTRKMQEINEAYAVLGSKENREKYNRYGEHWNEPPPPAPPPSQEEGPPSAGGVRMDPEAFSDFFRDMFGGGGDTRTAPFPTGGSADVEAELPLSLRESVTGVEKTFQLMATTLCTRCHGTGRVGREACPVCGGLGEIRQPRDVRARIPPGLLNGGRIRLKGQGGAGASGPGDLYLTIRLLPDPRFHVDGKNVETETRIMPWTAALGGEATVQTMDGETRIRIPAHTHSGRRLRLAGKGLGKPSERGDFFARIVIDVPATLSPKAEALLRQLQEESNG